MNPTELSQLLSLLIQDGTILLEQGQEMLRLVTSGLLSTDQLPLAFLDALSITPQDIRNAIIGTAAAFGGNHAVRLVRNQGGIPLSVRRRVRDALRTGFERTVTTLATVWARTGNLRRWHGGMVSAVRGHILQQTMAGLGRTLSAVQVTRILPVVRQQLTYLVRYAGHLAVRSANNLQTSVAYVANRSTQYAGTGWEWFWRGAEIAQTGDEGWIVHYRARDDNRTCSPCSDAGRNGPYRAGTNYPRPGATCLGAGHCRCSLEFEYNPNVYGQLA